MRSLNKISLMAAALMASTAMAQAADIIPEPTFDPVPEVQPVHTATGWYIRGDIGYGSVETDGVSYYQDTPSPTGAFETFEFDDTWSLQGGLGYQVNDYFRVDGTLTYFGSTDFTGSSAQGATCNAGVGYTGGTCDYSDNTELESATLLLANAYLDLGTVSGFTTYVGAGLGAAYVNYGMLLNDQTCTGSTDDALCSANDFKHLGESEWRFAYALHAGVSYDVSCRTKIDAGYTYTSIGDGNMFSGTTTGAGGNGIDHGLEMHTGHIGVRYALSDAGCHQPVYEQPQVVYK